MGHLGSVVFDDTAVQNEGAGVGQGVGAPTEVGIACAGVLEGDLAIDAAVLDGQGAIVLDHFIRSGASLFLADGMAVQIQGDGLVSGNGQGFSQSDIVLQSDDIILFGVGDGILQGSLAVDGGVVTGNDTVIHDISLGSEGIFITLGDRNEVAVHINCVQISGGITDGGQSHIVEEPNLCAGNAAADVGTQEQQVLAGTVLILGDDAGVSSAVPGAQLDIVVLKNDGSEKVALVIGAMIFADQLGTVHGNLRTGGTVLHVQSGIAGDGGLLDIKFVLDEGDDAVTALAGVDGAVIQIHFGSVVITADGQRLGVGVAGGLQDDALNLQFNIGAGIDAATVSVSVDDLTLNYSGLGAHGAANKNGVSVDLESLFDRAGEGTAGQIDLDGGFDLDRFGDSQIVQQDNGSLVGQIAILVERCVCIFGGFNGLFQRGIPVSGNLCDIGGFGLTVCCQYGHGQ